MKQTEQIPVLLVDAAGAAKLLCVGKSLLYEMASSGRLGPAPIEFNSKRLWSVEELQNWIRAGCLCRDKWLKLKGKKL